MQKINWRTLEEAQISEEYNRIQRVTDPVFDDQAGKDPSYNRSDADYFREERTRKAGENKARLLGFL